LTGLAFPNYSVPMETELGTLEEKVAQVAQLCQRLRAENSQLRQDLAASQNESKRLHQKIDGATQRLEALLTHIPEADA